MRPLTLVFLVAVLSAVGFFGIVGCTHTPSTEAGDSPVVQTEVQFDPTTDVPTRYRKVDSLKASGSGVFSPKGLKKIAAGAGEHLTILDLRREPHGYVNDEAVTWVRGEKSASADVPYDELLARETDMLLTLRGEETLERRLPSRLTASASPGPAPAPEKIEISAVRSERDVVEGAGHRYRRLTVAEFQPPDEEDVDRFLKIVKALPRGTWIHFHCRDGGSRTTDFLTLYDMLRSAAKTSYDDIRARQAKLATAAGVADRAEEDAGHYAGERERMLRRFYDYAKKYGDYYSRGYYSADGGTGSEAVAPSWHGYLTTEAR